VRIFTCEACGQIVFFESVRCARCGRVLAFLQDRLQMSALEPDGEPSDGVWRTLASGADNPLYRLCKNSLDHQVCNWGIPAEDPDPYCRACRLNHLIPNLADPGAREAWHRMEIGKRRLLYTLLGFGLPVETKGENPEGGLAFDFLKDGDQSKVFTGHSDGIITINIAEADDPFREKTRELLGETYRTVLGHFRHESGHYYWDRLVATDRARLDAFRASFGDERASYDEARDRHYNSGPPAAWWDRYVSAYASMHPWEDWAETWGHYLHIHDGMETARAYGLSLRPAPVGAPPEPAVSARRVDLGAFDELIAGWVPLTLALNSMNRSFGMHDPYPFVLTAAAVDKLRFVHEVISAAAGTRPSSMPRVSS
jgi:hypothetical protein